MEKLNTPGKDSSHSLRILRPLAWWLVLVLVLFGVRTHQRLREQTRLVFSVSMQGRNIGHESSVQLDGKPFAPGEQLPIGSHNFSVSHPKGVTFSTNFFVVYGKRDFGTIDLQRAMGSLRVEANSPTPLISISGPELELTLTNSSGTNLSVPTDSYVVKAKYKYWEKVENVFISESSTQTTRFTPSLGRLQLSCNQNDASFVLNKLDGRSVEVGRFPSTLSDLPEGSYELVALHHDHQKKQIVKVGQNETNDLKVEFIYGSAVFETEPSGATVWSDEKRNLGKTPLKLSELNPGDWKFVVRLDGYEPVYVQLQIQGEDTQKFRTNLVNTSYLGAIGAARRFISTADYGRALEAALEALRIQPGDALATSLKHEAIGLDNLLLAEQLGRKGDYIAGINKLIVALAAMPDNEEAKRLMADFNERKPEQIERIRVERLNRPKATFDTILATVPNSELFESFKFKSPKPFTDVELAICAEFQKRQPEFRVMRRPEKNPETFYIEAVQELSTYLATSAGKRQCVIVGGQTKDDETEIFFKILEYKTEAQIKFSIGNLIGTPVAVDFVPIHPSRVGPLTEKLKARIAEGVSNVTMCIEGAIAPSPVKASL